MYKFIKNLFFRNLAGRVLSEVSAFLHTLFYSNEEICFEYLPAGKIVYLF